MNLYLFKGTQMEIHVSHCKRLVTIPMYASSIYLKISYSSFEHAEAFEIQMITLITFLRVLQVPPLNLLS
jgi:hypothetical protein